MNTVLRSVLLALGLLAVVPAGAQTSATSLSSRVVYASAFEQAALAPQTPRTEAEYLAQLLAVNPASTTATLQQAEGRLSELYAQLDKEKIGTKPLARQVRSIFELAHQRFLTKYEDAATFDRTVQSGVYNCVSASALYALIFEHYHIPYAIRQKPTHVYLVADPQASNIMVETTAPTFGYFLPDAKFKKAYVDYLVDSKLVSQSEVQQQGLEEIFKQKFQADKTISLPQLISLQYYNQGVLALQADEDEKAYHALKKAEKLFPATETNYLLTQSLAARLEGNGYNKLEDVQLLTEFYARQPATKYRDECVNAFKTITQKFLLERGDTAMYRTMYGTFLGSVSDTSTRHSLSYVYYMQLGRMLAMQQHTEQAFPLLLQAFRYNRVSPELQGLISAVVQDEINVHRNSVGLLQRLDKYSADYPFLRSTAPMRQAYLYSYARAAYDAFMGNKRAEGKKYLTAFEQAYARKEATIDASQVATIYLAASIASGKANDLTGARAYARKGLAFEPTNPDLKRIASMN
ncbi:hypothetical protein [Hymenobacter metallilatus]|uniref:Tetratricopeptide repeat protein n=1 Tax=Hymenobacter metallilatus TaxID=2493666 RepID=A0A3R9MKZ6_9BACT|nr:hypothetical protein [Hymenobacter metallilatus]RSK34507.1 hypothetical protein EI290_07710 [Hymenobacter metallilatus]